MCSFSQKLETEVYVPVMFYLFKLLSVLILCLWVHCLPVCLFRVHACSDLGGEAVYQNPGPLEEPPVLFQSISQTVTLRFCLFAVFERGSLSEPGLTCWTGLRSRGPGLGKTLNLGFGVVMAVPPPRHLAVLQTSWPCLALHLAGLEEPVPFAGRRRAPSRWHLRLAQVASPPRQLRGRCRRTRLEAS